MNQRIKILVMHPDRAFVHTISQMLREDYDVLFAGSAKDVFHVLSNNSVELLLIDPSSPSNKWICLIENLKRGFPDLHLIAMAAEEEMHIAVKALQRGVQDILVKPFRREDILKAIHCCLRHRAYVCPSRTGADGAAGLTKFERMVGNSRQMEKVFRFIASISHSEATVLIQGESGTGKELAARAIHRQSRRREKPFVVINCAAIPAPLMESEIFGYNKGAFTGADRTTAGKMEIARGGTVFLDDIDSLNVYMQGKLLRLIQEKEFERLGSTAVIRADVRFVAATNKDLEELVRKGSFREDLYYRLHVLPLQLPPLRERKRDIPLLLKYFLQKQASNNGMPLKLISPGAMRLLSGYAWPGNVRQLENLVERLCATCPADTIRSVDVPESCLTQTASVQRTLKEAVRQFEQQLIKKTLEKVNGNKTKAAKLLGIHRNTLMAKTVGRRPWSEA